MDEAAPRVRQPRRWRVLAGAFGAVVAAIGALGALAGIADGDYAGAVLVGVGFAFMGYIPLRPALSWVQLTPEALEVCNWPLRRSVPWSDVSDVAMRWTGSVVVSRLAHRRLGLAALSGNRLYDLSWRNATVAEIHWRAGGAATAEPNRWPLLVRADPEVVMPSTGPPSPEAARTRGAQMRRLGLVLGLGAGLGTLALFWGSFLLLSPVSATSYQTEHIFRGPMVTPGSLPPTTPFRMTIVRSCDPALVQWARAQAPGCRSASSGRTAGGILLVVGGAIALAAPFIVVWRMGRRLPRSGSALGENRLTMRPGTGSTDPRAGPATARRARRSRRLAIFGLVLVGVAILAATVGREVKEHQQRPWARLRADVEAAPTPPDWQRGQTSQGGYVCPIGPGCDPPHVNVLMHRSSETTVTDACSGAAWVAAHWAGFEHAERTNPAQQGGCLIAGSIHGRTADILATRDRRGAGWLDVLVRYGS